MPLDSQPKGSSLARVAFLGVILPVVFALVNQRLVGRMIFSYDVSAMTQVCAVLLGEAGVFGVLCARFLEPARAHWAAYVWMWALMDLSVFPLLSQGLSWRHPLALLTPALLSAQLAVLSVWAVFGQAPWTIRWPITSALFALGICFYLHVNPSGPHRFPLMIASQSAAFLFICVLLYWRGLRLVVVGQPGPTAKRDLRQFGVRHVVLWMTLLAIVLATARALDVLTPSSLSILFERGSVLMRLGGFLTALVLTAALWAMLGKGSASRKWSVFVIVVMAGEFALGICYWRQAGAFWSSGPWRALIDPWFWDFYLLTHWPLIVWMGLAAAMLTAALLFHWTLGYRLLRSPPPREMEKI